MLDTDPIHVSVFADLMAPHGIDVDEAFYLHHIHGRVNSDFFAEVIPDVPDHQGLSDRKEAEFRARLPRPFPAMPGVAALLDRAAAAGWGLAVVTNAMRLNAEAMLGAIGLRDRFAEIVIGEECAHSKPHPAPYLEAMRRLGADPARTLAFEDSPSGIRSAVASGALTVGVRSSLSDADLRALGACLTIQDFTDPALAPLLARLEGVPA